MAVLLLVAIVMAVLLLAGLGGGVLRYVSAGICKVAGSGGLVVQCEPPGPPGGPRVVDPYAPDRPCLVHSDTHYLEETVTIPTKRVDVRSGSRGTMQLNKFIGPDGRPYWEVADFTWGEGGVATPDLGSGPLTVGAWGGLMVTNGRIYRFDDEDEARDFYRRLEEHRIGDDLKFTVRTNPITGGLVWLGTRLPGVGDDIDDWIGGSEPDRPPSAEYLEGGLTGGFKGEGALWKLKIPFKGRGWLIGGSRTDHRTGRTTTYFTERGEGEVAVQIDLSDIWRLLPKGARERAAAGMDDALEAALSLLEKQLGGRLGPDFRLPAGDRTQIKNAIKLNPSAGLNYKHRGGTTWAVTEDKDGDIVGLSKIDNSQDLLYLRVDGRLTGIGPGGTAKAGAGGQWVLLARRTLTERSASYSDPDGRRTIDDFLRTGNGRILDGYFEQGGGQQSRIVFDVDGNTTKMDGKGSLEGRKRDYGGLFELGEEWETHSVKEAQYFRPGTGWVTWTGCR